jgi:hypothetical protein
MRCVISQRCRHSQNSIPMGKPRPSRWPFPNGTVPIVSIHVPNRKRAAILNHRSFAQRSGHRNQRAPGGDRLEDRALVAYTNSARAILTTVSASGDARSPTRSANT